jgi:hypothetical protein
MESLDTFLVIRLLKISSTGGLPTTPATQFTSLISSLSSAESNSSTTDFWRFVAESLLEKPAEFYANIKLVAALGQ